MKRTNKNRQAEYLQTGKSERTAVRAAKCVTDYGQENTDVDFRKDKGQRQTALDFPASIGNQNAAMYIHQPRNS